MVPPPLPYSILTLLFLFKINFEINIYYLLEEDVMKKKFRQELVKIKYMFYVQN